MILEGRTVPVISEDDVANPTVQEAGGSVEAAHDRDTRIHPAPMTYDPRVAIAEFSANYGIRLDLLPATASGTDGSDNRRPPKAPASRIASAGLGMDRHSASLAAADGLARLQRAPLADSGKRQPIAASSGIPTRWWPNEDEYPRIREATGRAANPDHRPGPARPDSEAGQMAAAAAQTIPAPEDDYCLGEHRRNISRHGGLSVAVGPVDKRERDFDEVCRPFRQDPMEDAGPTGILAF
jgi:hypothetical protein